MNVTFRGAVASVGEVKTVGKNNIKKLPIRFNVDGGNTRFPDVFEVEAFGQDAERLSSTAKPGQVVDVTAQLRGRVWVPADGRPDRAILSLAFVSAELVEDVAPEPPPPGETAPEPPADEELPF